jgi:hypothetical protein
MFYNLFNFFVKNTKKIQNRLVLYKLHYLCNLFLEDNTALII